MLKKIDNQKSKIQNPKHGFTLIELIIAISILSLVIVMLGGAMSLAIRSVEKGEREVVELERLRSVILTMDRQVQSLIPSTHDKDGEKVVWFEGDEKGCLFLTNASLWGRKDAFVEVSYSISDYEDGTLRVIETERLMGEEEGLETVLLEGLEEAEFAYFFTDTDGEGKWTDSWDRKDKFPEAVALHIKSGKFDHKLIFPLMRRVSSKSTMVKGNSGSGIFKENLMPFK